MKFVFMKTQNATLLSDQSDVRALYSCTERESRLFFVMLKQCFDWLSGEADSGERWQRIGCRICSRGSSQANFC